MIIKGLAQYMDSGPSRRNLLQVGASAFALGACETLTDRLRPDFISGWENDPDRAWVEAS